MMVARNNNKTCPGAKEEMSTPKAVGTHIGAGVSGGLESLFSWRKIINSTRWQWSQNEQWAALDRQTDKFWPAPARHPLNRAKSRNKLTCCMTCDRCSLTWHELSEWEQWIRHEGMWKWVERWVNGDKLNICLAYPVHLSFCASDCASQQIVHYARQIRKKNEIPSAWEERFVTSSHLYVDICAHRCSLSLSLSKPE